MANKITTLRVTPDIMRYLEQAMRVLDSYEGRKHTYIEVMRMLIARGEGYVTPLDLNADGTKATRTQAAVPKMNFVDPI